MKAVVLAAGKGTRLNVLTKYRPKHLLPLIGRPIIEHVICELKNAGVTEIGIIVGYMKEKIMKLIGDGSKYGLNVTYIVQDEQLGTAHAIKIAEKFVGNERFIVVYGDITLKGKIILDALKRHFETNTVATIVTTEVDDPWNYGVIEVDENGIMKNIIEKPEKGKEPSNKINTGIYVLEGSKIYEVINRTQISKRGEYEITDTFKELLKMGEKIAILNTEKGWWKDVGRAWDLIEVNEYYMNEANYYGKIIIGEESVIESKCIIKPPVIIGKNCRIKSNSVIGPHTIIGDNVEIGVNSRIFNSIVMEDTCILNNVEIGYSIIGSNCLVEGNVKFRYTSTFNNIKMRIKGIEVDTGRKNMGAVVGDYSYIGCGSIVLPGISIYPNSIVTRWKIVYHDVDGFY
ncbi:MAG: NDP-sugar synthase [Candidatus Methanomethylicia archaeon]|nr:NDP-sugar synthase [Candidatus Methanomethylicia archaeon]